MEHTYVRRFLDDRPQFMDRVSVSTYCARHTDDGSVLFVPEVGFTVTTLQRVHDTCKNTSNTDM